jgi:hypothetical protein
LNVVVPNEAGFRRHRSGFQLYEFSDSQTHFL